MAQEESYFDTVLTEVEKHEIRMWWNRMCHSREKQIEEYRRNYSPTNPPPLLKSSFPGNKRQKKYSRKIAGRGRRFNPINSDKEEDWHMEKEYRAQTRQPV